MDREESRVRREAASCDVPGPTLVEPLRQDDVQTAIETAYRRGFDQGVAACLSASEIYGRSELEEWKQRLFKWRKKDHRGEVVYPDWMRR